MEEKERIENDPEMKNSTQTMRKGGIGNATKEEVKVIC